MFLKAFQHIPQNKDCHISNCHKQIKNRTGAIKRMIIYYIYNDKVAVQGRVQNQ